jgi:CelD/BcsL family acetyltransferase involved in cellulose biosynthesis
MTIAPSLLAPNDVASGCEAHLIRDAAHLDELEREWGALFDVAPTASPPLRWEWVREWWRIYGPIYGDGGRGLRLITVRRGADLVGVLPLYQRSTSGPWGSRQLRFISTGAADFEETSTEYLDLLHAPQESRACIEVISQILSTLKWDEVYLSDMSSQSPLLSSRGRLENWFRKPRELAAGPCYLFDISGGFDAYLGRLSHENRRQARKLLRAVDQVGMTFELANDGETIEQCFDQMVTLHKQRWATIGKPGSFALRHAEFHRSMARLLAPCGAVILARLALEGTPFAVVYGHRVGEKVYCYQQGVVPESKVLRSPGTAAWLLLMRTMAEQGVTLFDHQTGMTTFKERFSTGEHPLAELRVVKPTFRYLATKSGDLVRRAISKAARLIKKSLAGGPPLVGSAPVSPPRGSDMTI